MAFSTDEQETIIRTDASTNTWSVYTCQSKIANKLKRAGIDPVKVDDDGVYWFHNIPYNQISFRAKSKREYTDEQRAKMRENAKKMQEARMKKNQ